MHLIMAYSEFKRWKNKKIGGKGVEVETDVFTLGGKPKNGSGERRLNKCYIQALCERGGDVLFQIFPNPKGGPEALFQISQALDDHLLPYTILCSDAVRSLKCYCADRLDKNYMHCIVNHSQVSEHGFTWLLYVDHKDGEEFEDLVNGECRIVEVSKFYFFF